MQRTDNVNVNTKRYWEDVYSDPEKIEMCETESIGADHPIVIGNKWVFPSNRLLFLASMVREHEKIIDIGCGTGTIVRKVLEKYPFNEAWGVDISSNIVERNKEKIPGGIFFQQTIGNLDKVPENYFDIAFAGEVMEHLEDPLLLFKDAWNVLKDGGKFVVTTPFKKSVTSNEHVWYFNQDDVSNFYIQTGFSNIEFFNLPNMEKFIIIVASGEKHEKSSS